MAERKQTGLSVGKQMSKRVIARDNTPQAWKELMTQLRKARIAKGISTREVADKFGTGIGTLSKWERADRAMHPHDLLAILDMYGLEMVFREKEK